MKIFGRKTYAYCFRQALFIHCAQEVITNLQETRQLNIHTFYARACNYLLPSLYHTFSLTLPEKHVGVSSPRNPR